MRWTDTAEEAKNRDMSAFEELGLMPELIRGVEEMEWLLPTPVQSESIPLILGGGDVMAAAETGSGKTGAFALPLLQLVHETLTATQQQGSAGLADSAASKERPQCQLSTHDKDSLFTVSDAGLRCQATVKGWVGGRATVGAFSGSVYYEVTCESDGLCRVGWATRAASYEIGKDRRSFGYGSTGKKSHGGSFDNYGTPFGKGDIIGCMVDFSQRPPKVAFTVNGQDKGMAFVLPDHMKGRSNALFPAVSLKAATASVNFGNKPFKHLPPGYVSLSKAPAQALTTVAYEEEADASSSDGCCPTALILEPSRDLAQQVHDVISDMRKHLNAPTIRNTLIVGGTDPRIAKQQLQGGIHIITGTPGRIKDLVESGKLSLSAVKFFILDEADRLLDTGNQDLILNLFSRFPKAGTGTARLQVMMFSATLHSDEVKEIAKRICHQPILIDLKGKEAVPEAVDHVLVPVDPKQDRSWLQSQPPVPTDNAHKFDSTGPNIDSAHNWSQAVKKLKPRVLQRLIDAHKMEQCLVFCRTNFDCDNLERFFNALGGGGRWTGRKESGKESPYSCVVLAGARSTDERREALQAFKEGAVRFLICTDVAARGLDISGLPYVINVTLPDRAEDYIHRVGRVGRAEKLGLAISLVSKVPEKVWYCKHKGYKPWMEPKKRDVGTHEEGGHTIWYDEQQLLKDIEQRLRQAIEAVNPDMSLPQSIAARVSGQPGSGQVYGQHKEGGVSKEALEHLDNLRPAMDRLAHLEHLAQGFFFKRHRLSKQ